MRPNWADLVLLFPLLLHLPENLPTDGVNGDSAVENVVMTARMTVLIEVENLRLLLLIQAKFVHTPMLMPLRCSNGEPGLW